ncbi:MAG: N-acetyl-gamma-glutamyl-phosphate reductase, partial [Zetaproteobacteria bacterium]
EKLLARGVRVVDLSADFRHPDPDEYARAYGKPHPCPQLLAEAVYGLTEHHREAIAQAKLVANPGCYPTATLLALLPLMKAGAIDPARVVVDAKSGASGAGRSAKTELLLCELGGNMRAYGLPRHRHAWEMETQAELLAGVRPKVRFVPHILPIARGMLAALHLEGDARRWREVLEAAYRDAPFVRVLPEGALPQTKAVCGTNRCEIAVVPMDAHAGVVLSCIDNLGKGAAGQAVQNANLMLGLPETLGLADLTPWP